MPFFLSPGAETERRLETSKSFRRTRYNKSHSDENNKKRHERYGLKLIFSETNPPLQPTRAKAAFHDQASSRDHPTLDSARSSSELAQHARTPRFLGVLGTHTQGCKVRGF